MIERRKRPRGRRFDDGLREGFLISRAETIALLKKTLADVRRRWRLREEPRVIPFRIRDTPSRETKGENT